MASAFVVATFARSYLAKTSRSDDADKTGLFVAEEGGGAAPLPGWMVAMCSLTKAVNFEGCRGWRREEGGGRIYERGGGWRMEKSGGRMEERGKCP